MRNRRERSTFGQAAAPILAAVALLGGCGDEGRAELLLAAGAGAQFQAQAGPPRAVGYQLSVLVEQVQSLAHPTCPTLPAGFHLLVNDQEVPPAFDPSTGCLYAALVSPLAPTVGTVTVDAMDGEQSLAHAQFDGLAPGGGATLAVPADGQVRAGDEIVVVPPPDLPTGQATYGDFYPLDDTTVSAHLYAPMSPSRQADGLHMVVPAFSGRAAVTLAGMPYLPQPSYSCPGFDICTANADATLGPLTVTEGP
jgi:hypothetical protein